MTTMVMVTAMKEEERVARSEVGRRTRTRSNVSERSFVVPTNDYDSREHDNKNNDDDDDMATRELQTTMTMTTRTVMVMVEVIRTKVARKGTIVVVMRVVRME